MTTQKIVITILVMIAVSYLPRALPFVFCRKPIKNEYVLTFLEYLPFGVLAAMIFPDLFLSTAHMESAIIAFAVALLLSRKNYGLLTVAITAVSIVYILEIFLVL